MNAMTVSTAFLATTLALITFDAGACGESMFHSGQAMRYHTYISRQPANILVYRPGTPDSGSVQKQLYTGLEKAGHHVTVVTGGNALTQALAVRQYDVIIASARDMVVIAAELGKSSREPVLLAVLGRDAGSEAGVSERFPRTLHEGDGLNQYLKVIDQSMRTRGT